MDEDIEKRCLSLLRKCRRVAASWTTSIRANLQSIRQNDAAEELSKWLLEAALVCYLTFDVAAKHFSSVLDPSSDDITDIVESSIIIYDNSPSDTKKLPQLTKILLMRQSRLAHRIEPYLRQTITRNTAAMHAAVTRIWNAFSPNRVSNWVALEAPNDRWVVITTSTADGSNEAKVSYNILTGSLLINGTPLSRLPRLYELFPEYKRLFGTVSNLLSGNTVQS